MIKITILIPTTYNDKMPVAFRKSAGYIYDIEKLADGCTIDGRVNGFFTAADGANRQDDLIKVWIAGEKKLLTPMRCIARRIAADLQQESVYLEWHEVNVEFIKPALRDRNEVY